jgi:hypothetical protein
VKEYSRGDSRFAARDTAIVTCKNSRKKTHNLSRKWDNPSIFLNSQYKLSEQQGVEKRSSGSRIRA